MVKKVALLRGWLRLKPRLDHINQGPQRYQWFFESHC